MAQLCLAKSVEAELRQLPGNNICADCDAKAPQWASVSLGVFMCLECSGQHRALGVHISFVRSVTMDSWSEKQIHMMRIGGNDKFNNFLKEYGVPKTLPIAQKYETSAAKHYRERLQAEANGLPPPSTRPERYNPAKAGAADSKGSDPIPGETETEYVARQRKLQEEARERMRQKFGQSNGLSSSGRMQGIGSDSSYRPDSNSSLDFDVNQLADVSQKALSFFQTSFAVIGEQVSKTTQQLLDEQQSSSSSENNQLSSAWGSIATGAIGFWNKATEATSGIIEQISAGEEEEDFRFPRPPELQSSYSRPPPAPATVLVPPPVPVSHPPLQPLTQPSLMRSSSYTSRDTPPAVSTPLKGTPTPSKVSAAPAGDDFFATFGV